MTIVVPVTLIQARRVDTFEANVDNPELGNVEIRGSSFYTQNEETHLRGAMHLKCFTEEEFAEMEEGAVYDLTLTRRA